MNQRYSRIATFCLVFFSLLGTNQAVADLTAKDGWVRALPPTQPNTAAFLTLSNSGEKSIVLVDVRSEAAKKVEYHSHKKQASGMMAMRQEKSITIAPGAEFVFKPGSYHIMLMGLTKPLKSGNEVNITLVSQSGTEYPITLPVKSPMDEQNHQHHHHH
ncbi:copper chaperone PCu(A)C [Bermanella marisrubri]|uniref:Copper chaperone PCu(A)C n=1 Tax=Bermanella marisrubri TaxID=207949 RepID=Q1N3J4_9GAMM|nr:copper chaperone PCu(A)C [Bermanella marisrubri]EAT12880.1 hypothetical protein RED65_12444 [Oceanobacter sp. RED65] [Bermanella marisrubri]QIZ83200.1 copper chaperone PCu(A)C [Bermanella marisrubri]